MKLSYSIISLYLSLWTKSLFRRCVDEYHGAYMIIILLNGELIHINHNNNLFNIYKTS